MDGRMHEIVHALIDGFPASGEVDFVEAIAVPFPIKVISEILGFPAGEYQTFSGGPIRPWWRSPAESRPSGWSGPRAT